MKEPKWRISVRIIAFKEFTNIFMLQNKFNFSLLIKINLIQSEIYKAFLFLVYDYIYHLSVMLFSSSPFSNMEVLLLNEMETQSSIKCKLVNALLQYSYTHFRRLNTWIYL